MNSPLFGEVYHRLLSILSIIINPSDPDPTVIGPDESISGDLGFSVGAFDNLTKSINDEFFTTTPMSQPEVQTFPTVIKLAHGICKKPAQK
jgi:hypothetical protein